MLYIGSWEVSKEALCVLVRTNMYKWVGTNRNAHVRYNPVP